MIQAAKKLNILTIRRTELKLTLQDYYEFLEKKIDVVEWSGFEIDVSELHPDTFPHQKDAIVWAGRIGRAARSAKQ